MVKPVTLACGHSGCQSCLATAFTMSSSPKCPLCKKVFPSGATLNVNIVLDDITSRLEIKCTNSGCEWVGKLVNHSQHSNTCAKLLVECQNRGCMEKKAREEMGRHISQCEKQELPCRESLCSHKRIPCPLSCGTNLPW